jgi:hypothetical protein
MTRTLATAMQRVSSAGRQKCETQDPAATTVGSFLELMSFENRAAAYGFFPLESQLENVFRALNHAGFENTDLCVLLTAEHPIAERVRNCPTQMPRGPIQNAAPERVLGWLSTYGAVLIANVGLFVGSRDCLRVLSLPEDLLRSEMGVFGALGIPPDEAARYRNRLRNNAAFILVNCEHFAHSEWARELLSTMGAEEASLLGNRYRDPEESETKPPTIN